MCQRSALEPTLALHPCPVFQASVESAVILHPVESMLPAMLTQTNVSARMDLLETETSCVCLQSCLLFVLLVVDLTVIVPTVFPTNVFVMMATQVIPTRAVLLPLRNLEKTAAVETMLNV